METVQRLMRKTECFTVIDRTILCILCILYSLLERIHLEIMAPPKGKNLAKRGFVNQL